MFLVQIDAVLLIQSSCAILYLTFNRLESGLMEVAEAIDISQAKLPKPKEESFEGQQAGERILYSFRPHKLAISISANSGN